MDHQNLTNQKAITLHALIKRLEITKNGDPCALEAVRKIVSDELLGSQGLEVTAQVLGYLNANEARRLNDIVNYCSTNFNNNQKLLNAIAVPMSMFWKSRINRTYTIYGGNQDDLDTFALNIKNEINADEIKLENKLYTIDELIRTSPANLLERLQSIINGSQNYTNHPIPSSIRSRIDLTCQMRYFLGVEIQHPDERRILDSEETQRSLQKWLYLAEEAVAKKRSLLIEGTPDRTATCHGIFYLERATKIGEKVIRGQRLKSLIENVASNEYRIEIFHSFNPLFNHVDLLVSSEWLTLKYRWLLFADESTADFDNALREAINLSTVQCEEVIISTLDPTEFEHTASKSGLSWMKRFNIG